MNAEDLLDELLDKSASRRLFEARNVERYRCASAVGIAIARGFAARYDRIAEMLDVMRVAVAIADSVGDPDLQAEAYAHLGNALRINSRFADAGVAFAGARRALLKARNVLTRARACSLEASFCTATRDLDKALSLLLMADAIFRDELQEQERGPIQIQIAICEGYLGRPSSAVRLLTASASRVETRRQALAFHSAMAVNLLEAGHPDSAERSLFRLRRLLSSTDGRLVELRALWLEGRIAAVRGRRGRAADLFSLARTAFESEGMLYESAVAGVEHALALTESGHPDEALPHLLSVETLLSAMGVAPEASSARLLRGVIQAGVAVSGLRQTLLSLRVLPAVAA